MPDAKSLLIELGTEELPPKALDDLSTAFARGICEGLVKHGISADTANARAYNSPRRLAVHVPAVATTQPEQAVERRGPAVSASLGADGTPSKALVGFAQSCGVAVEALEKLETDKGAWFVYRAVLPGKATADLLPEILEETLKALPIPRPMRWGDHDYTFVRPAHWLVMLHGADVVNAEVLGLRSGRQSRGHRFHHPQPVHIADADAWLEALRAAKVLADPVEREAVIRDRPRAVALKEQLDLHPQIPPGLMQELVNLTEWPTPVLCRFEDEYLKLPHEVLRTTMETNQRFISTLQRAGIQGADPTAVSNLAKLSEHFIGIANIESKDPAQIRKGYERVIRPRFADAKFFYEEDLKTPLADYQGALKNVTYQKALGSVWDKCVRVAELARVIANRVGVDAGLATRAASLAKCDLMTRMVGEFPELQGVMGRYYATAQGEPVKVAQALDEFYMPRQSGDRIATGGVARVLAVAERLDTLAGIFAVGLKPSGNKDPFALRRAALGLARTLIEGGLDIDLKAAFLEALELLPDGAGAAARRPALARELYDFVIDRLRGYYADKGFTTGQFDAVAAVAPASLLDFDRRLRAVAEFAGLPEAASLAAANKRVGNILRKQETSAQPAKVDPGLFEHDAERDLAAALDRASGESDRLVAGGDYAGALARLAGLQAPVDRFFDEVLVIAENPVVRANRLALLGSLKDRFLAIADIARL